MGTELSCQAARTLVSAYINRELDAPHALALEAHIQSCPTCPALYASLMALQHRLRASHRPMLASEDVLRMAVRVREALRDGHHAPSSSEGTAE
jgi:anti-sigma factor RsiW